MENLKPSAVNSCPLTPLSFLDRAAYVYGDYTSIIYGSTTYTWSQTHRRCLQLASSISSLGIGRNDVVSVVAPNVPATYELQFAVPFSGAVLNNINTRLDARNVAVLLQHAGSKLVFVDFASASLVLDAISLFPENTPPPELVLIPDNEVTGCSGFRWTNNYEEFLERGDPGFEWVRPETGSDPMVLNYTSGTTSSPKGVVKCHVGLYVMAVNTLLDWSVPKQPVYLWTLPVFHCNGWSFPYGIAALGGVNVMVRKVDPPLIYDLIERHGVTHMCGAPVVLNILSNYYSRNKNNKPLGRRVHVMTAGAPPPASVILKTEAMGFVVRHVYGMTEAGGPVVSCEWKPEWDTLPAPTRAGLRARQGVRMHSLAALDVLDTKTGESVPRDGIATGEIVVKGATVMLGYFKDPEGTDKVIKNGWLYTGDVGVVHPDGYLEVKDRCKDVIISGGENLSSVEVESVLYTHPAVNEVAVVARPDSFWGESPCAFLSFKEKFGSARPGEKEIVEYCRERLPHFMVPKTVVVKDELPKTSTGKIQKFILREEAKKMGPK